MTGVLGDSHNFGRRVSVREGRVVKPRALLWEWLVLCGESPLRRLFAEAAEKDGLGAGVFGFLPSLGFTFAEDGPGGEVEKLELSPVGALTEEGRRGLAEIGGRAIALWSWLGVTDLHWENLALGVDGKGNIVFAPLDVEMILGEMGMPAETKLIPDADPEVAAICQHACGARRLLPYLGKPVEPGDLVAMVGAYREMLGFLDRHSEEIARVFGGLPGLRETPIRVCLRGTEEYVRAREWVMAAAGAEGAEGGGAGGGGEGGEEIWPPLLDEEVEQLERGDIPYFFRLYGKKGIHYYADESLKETGTLPLEGDVPQLDPLLQVGKGLRSGARKRLKEEGLLTVIGAFDHPVMKGTHESRGVEVAFRGKTLVVKLPSGEEVESRRDMSDFVSSVYQPCQCGEVREVLVPAVTVCRGEGESRGGAREGGRGGAKSDARGGARGGERGGRGGGERRGVQKSGGRPRLPRP